MNLQRRQQQQREQALKQLIASVPEPSRAQWTQRDYGIELARRAPRYFMNFKGNQIHRFWHDQTVIKAPPTHHDAPPSHDDQVDMFNKLQPLTGALRDMSINKGDLQISPAYQRDSVDWGKVERMAAAPDMCALGRLIVALRAGRYWVVDGQHRKLMADKRNDIIDLPCMVFDSDDESVEAALFAKINMARSAVRPLDGFKARVMGHDPVAQTLQQVLDELGISVVKKAMGPNELAAISTAYAMAQRDMECARAVLTVTQACSPRTPIEGDILRGMEYLDRHLVDRVTDERFIARAKKVGSQRMLEDIKKARAMKSTAPMQMGRLMLKLINTGLAEPRQFQLKDL